MQTRRTHLATLLAIASGSLWRNAAEAAVWQPDKTVSLLVGVAAGGALDITARSVQGIWTTQDLVRVPVIVNNRPGAGGAIATNMLAMQQGSAQTLAFVSSTLVSNALIGVSRLGPEDFTPLGLLANDYIAFVVPAASPIRTGQDLLARMKDESFNIGNAAQAGNANHIALARVAQSAGIDPSALVVAIYKSGSESMTALLGGQIDMVTTTSYNAVGLVAAGKVRIVALAAPKRLSGILANVPTWREQGVDVVYGLWRGVIGPKDMTTEQVAYWSDVLAKAVATGKWKDTARQNYWNSTFLDAKAFAEFLLQDREQQSRALHDLKLIR